MGFKLGEVVRGVDLGNTLMQSGGTPAEPVIQADPNEQKILKFIGICHVSDGLTYREIANGCDLPIASVKTALASLVQKGMLTSSEEPEPNYRRYRLTATVPAASSGPASEPTADERWARESRQRVLAAEASRRAPESKRYTPTEEEITAELERRKQVTPLTDAEGRELELGAGRVPINPQIAVRK
jgi:hypothetical protein